MRASLAEDLGEAGDLTTLATIPAGLRARAQVVCRQPAVIAGLVLFEPLATAFRERGKSEEEADSLAMGASVADGASVAAGTAICTVDGTARALVTIERTLLNFLGRLSGVATLTRAYVDAVRATGRPTRVLDTRKTTPGYRALEKYAVACGGGSNHRLGLHDAILVKDNHVAAAGGITPALERALAGAPKGMEVEVECDRLEQVSEAVAGGARAILLDNFPPADVARAVALVAGRARIEVSGNVTLETIAGYAKAGADDISVGRLTHSAPAVDLAMEIELTR